MLTDWLYFLCIGLLMAYPLTRVLRLLQRRGIWRARPLYLRTYQPAPSLAARAASVTPEAPAKSADRGES